MGIISHCEDKLARGCGPQQSRPLAKQPPFPGDIHDATRQVPSSIGFGSRLEGDVYGRWSELSPGLAPESRGRERYEDGRDCNGQRTLSE